MKPAYVGICGTGEFSFQSYIHMCWGGGGGSEKRLRRGGGIGFSFLTLDKKIFTNIWEDRS